MKIDKSTKEQYYIDGRYTDCRKKLQEDIINNFLGNVSIKNEQPTAILLGGGSASGKSTLSNFWIELYKTIQNPLVQVDCDEIKAFIPEYDDIKVFNPSIAAVIVHDESSDIADDLIMKCIEQKKNFLYDGTMKNLEKYKRLVGDLKKNSYHIIMTVVDAPIEIAKERARVRALETKREVPEEVIEVSHREVPKTFRIIKDMVDEYTLYDTSGIKPIEIVEKVKGSGAKIYDPKRLKEFYNKSE